MKSHLIWIPISIVNSDIVHSDTVEGEFLMIWKLYGAFVGWRWIGVGLLDKSYQRVIQFFRIDPIPSVYSHPIQIRVDRKGYGNFNEQIKTKYLDTTDESGCDRSTLCDENYICNYQNHFNGVCKSCDDILDCQNIPGFTVDEALWKNYVGIPKNIKSPKDECMTECKGRSCTA